QERQSGSMIRYQALKKKPVIVAQASGSEPFQEQSTEEPKELYEEDLKEILEIVPVEETKAEGCKWKKITHLEPHLKGGVLLGPERPRTFDDLNDNDKKRFDVDVRATNIVLQGLPKDIYKLINHNIEAKSIWDNVKMILAGSKLTKEDRESQLYDEFECFKMLPGENINEYYDMFVIAFKLNKGLKETNHEQLYAYLKQHEKHAAQDRLIIERITPTTNDQLAFVSSVQPYTQSSHVQSHQYPPSLAPLQSPHVQSL
ncbi:hypothetical protein Tco_1415525, partial [Tanacetum coccineum]